MRGGIAVAAAAFFALAGMALAGLALAGFLALAPGPARAAGPADRLPDLGPLHAVAAAGNAVTVGGATVSVTGHAASVHAGGASVDIHADTDRDVWAGGGEVAVDGRIGGTLHAAGGSVSVRGAVAGDATLAGGSLTVAGDVAGLLRAVGAAVTVAAGTTIGRVDAGGAGVRFAGHVTGPARFAGETVTLEGRFDGPVSVAASNVVIGPTAIIVHDIDVFSGNDPVVRPGAKIGGALHRAEPRGRFGLPGWAAPILFALFLALGVILTGVILVFALGGVLSGAGVVMRHSPLPSLLWGILTLVAVPLLALLLMATLVGLPFGVALLFLLPFLAVAGYATAAIGFAGWFFIWRERPLGTGRMLIFLVVGALLLGALGFLPYAGPVLVWIVVLVGLGAFVRALVRRVRLGDLEIAGA